MDRTSLGVILGIGFGVALDRGTLGRSLVAWVCQPDNSMRSVVISRGCFWYSYTSESCDADSDPVS